MPLSPCSLWIRPICPGDAESLQSQDKRRPSLANSSSRWRTPPKRAGNYARNNNGKSPAPDAPRAGPVLIGALLQQLRALLPYARVSDRTCDTSSPGPTPMLRRLWKNLDQASSLSQTIAQPLQCRLAVYPAA